MLLTIVISLILHVNFVACASGSEVAVISDTLRWNYTHLNPECRSPWGQDLCRDVRVCKNAIASLMMGGWPTICSWVGKGVPRVCCGYPLILGDALMKKIEEEKARARGCGRKLWGPNLSPTEDRYQEIIRNLPEIDISQPENFNPPLDLTYKSIVSPVGGRPSRQGEFPWMIAIFKDGSFYCGGSLIDRVHILSAAHCFVSDRGAPQPPQYIARIGDINVDSGVPFAVIKIKIHEDYDPRLHYNDIAILTLEQEILTPRVPHICLSNGEMEYTGRNTTLLGWGDTEFGGKKTPILHIVDDLPVWTNEECNHAYRKIDREALPIGITEKFICAGRIEGGKDACQSDSGGPLMYRTQTAQRWDSVWVLVGIVSFGYMCGEPGYPGVYTRVSSFIDWIQENTQY